MTPDPDPHPLPWRATAEAEILDAAGGFVGLAGDPAEAATSADIATARRIVAVVNAGGPRSVRPGKVATPVDQSSGRTP